MPDRIDAAARYKMGEGQQGETFFSPSRFFFFSKVLSRPQLLHLGDDFKSDFDGTTAKLTILQVYPEDEGEYTCVAYNDLGKDCTSARLFVDVPEEKDNLLSQHLSRPPGFVSDCDSNSLSTSRTTARRSVSAMARPRQREASSTEPKIRRLKATPPKFYTVPHNRVAEVGETVRFQCSVAGHPEPWVAWEKDGNAVVLSGRLSVTERDDVKTLEINEVTVQDSGLYKIILENCVGKIEASARLEVLAHRGFSLRGIRARSSSPRPSPTYDRYLGDAYVRTGGLARFAFDLKSSYSNVRWYKDGIPLDSSGKYTVTCSEDVVPSDKGSYECLVEDAEGFGKIRGELKVFESEVMESKAKESENLGNVKIEEPLEILENLHGYAEAEPPHITEELPQLLVVEEGEELLLEIKAQGSGPFDVIWMKDGCFLPDCEDFQQNDDGNGNVSLLIPDVFAEDAGNYRCEVYNKFGEAMSRCRLVVKGTVTLIISDLM